MKRLRSPLTVTMLLIVLSTAPANAYEFKLAGQDVTLNITNTLVYTYHFDNDKDPAVDLDDKYHQVQNILDLSLAVHEFRIGGRVDLNVFGNTFFDQECQGAPASNPDTCRRHDHYYANSLVPERIYLIWARPDFDMTLGDFYVSFGKGLALNITKLDSLGQDTTLRGGKFVLHKGDAGITLVAGELNPLNVDEARGVHGIVADPEAVVQLTPAPWASEPLLGARLEYRFFDSVLAGVHGVWVISDNPALNAALKQGEGTDYEAIWGASLQVDELFDGLLSFSAEVDLQRTVQLGDVIRGPGHILPFGAEENGLKGLAAYTSVNLNVGNLVVQGEFKYYNDFILRAPQATDEPYILLYHQPPTLERINSEVTDNANASGFRLRADYNFGEVGPLELLVFGSYGYFRTWGNGALHEVHDPYAGVELTWMGGDGHLNLVGGARLEKNRKDGELYRREIHLELDLEQTLWGNHGFKVHAFYQNRQKVSTGLLTTGLDQWHELDSSIEYKWSPHLSVGMTIEVGGDPGIEPDGHSLYFGGALRYFITGSSSIAVRVGENRPGLKCLSGQCRVHPAFAGVQVMGVGRF